MDRIRIASFNAYQNATIPRKIGENIKNRSRLDDFGKRQSFALLCRLDDIRSMPNQVQTLYFGPLGKNRYEPRYT